MSEVAESFELNFASLIQFEDFQLFYFDIFQMIDEMKSQDDLERKPQDTQGSTQKLKDGGYTQLVNEVSDFERKIDLSREVDTSSQLYEKLNDPKNKDGLLQQLKPKPRKLEPI